MSTISGNCSTPVSQQLFEYGLEKNRNQQQIDQQQQKPAPVNTDSTETPGINLVENLKGNNIDLMA